MIELKKGAVRLETKRCPLCKESIEGDEFTLARHVAALHAAPKMRMGEIIWTKPPHEAVFMGRLYKRVTPQK